MTQEALRMALDALETELSIDWGNQDEFNASAEKMYEAIVAIKEALAQEQEPAWVGLMDDEIDQGLLRTPYAMKTAEAWREGVRWAYHQLKEKNT